MIRYETLKLSLGVAAFEELLKVQDFQYASNGTKPFSVVMLIALSGAPLMPLVDFRTSSCSL